MQISPILKQNRVIANSRSKLLSDRNDSSSIAITLTSPDHFYLKSTPPVRLLCFDLSNFSRLAQFFICSAAIFVFFLTYSYTQESIFRLKSYSQFGWYLTWLQFAIYTILSHTERVLTGESHERKISLSKYTQLALYTVGTIGFSNASLAYLNYPTNVIFKCCKLIPVLIGGIVIQGKRYGVIEFLAAGCMSIGLILFTLADVNVTPNFNAKGYIFISIALLGDAAIGNVQEKEIKQHNAKNSEIVLYSHAIGFFYVLAIIICTGEIFSAALLFNEETFTFYYYAFIFSLVGFLGVNIIITLVRTFGAFVAVTVTTFRKALTIVMSFLLFSKPFTMQYLWSGMVVLLGVYLSVAAKNSDFAAKIHKLNDKLKHMAEWLFINRNHRSDLLAL
uniref:Adenosine 3'-phospho 5'-phosphosulfate transporter 2 n=1 Tax=Romanomermis culicivorax TaxID=13658 RepID=A0A915IIC6_ROMCU